MANAANIKQALSHLGTPDLTISVSAGQIVFRSIGRGEDSKQRAIAARRAASGVIRDMFAGRRIFRMRQGGGTVWKARELSCDFAWGVWEAGIRIELTEQERENVLMGLGW